jgi:hypothetical protein
MYMKLACMSIDSNSDVQRKVYACVRVVATKTIHASKFVLCDNEMQYC